MENIGDGSGAPGKKNNSPEPLEGAIKKALEPNFLGKQVPPLEQIQHAVAVGQAVSGNFDEEAERARLIEVGPPGSPTKAEAELKEKENPQMRKLTTGMDEGLQQTLGSTFEGTGKPTNISETGSSGQSSPKSDVNPPSPNTQPSSNGQS